MDKPKRRYELELRLGADSAKDVIGHLYSLMIDLERHDLENTPLGIVSGGYSCGFYITIQINRDITHDTWEKELNAYLDSKNGGE